MSGPIVLFGRVRLSHQTGWGRGRNVFYRPRPQPTDLTEEEWRRVEPLLPQHRSGKGQPRKASLRTMVNGILYLLRTNHSLRDPLPPGMPPWGTLHGQAYRWARDGTLQRVFSAIGDPRLVEAARERLPTLFRPMPKEPTAKMSLLGRLRELR
jgi:transposase